MANTDTLGTQQYSHGGLIFSATAGLEFWVQNISVIHSHTHAHGIVNVLIEPNGLIRVRSLTLYPSLILLLIHSNTKSFSDLLQRTQTTQTTVMRAATLLQVQEVYDPAHSCDYRAGDHYAEYTTDSDDYFDYTSVADEISAHGSARVLAALFEAAAHGDLTKVIALVQSHASSIDVNAQNEDGETVLHLAVSGGHHDIVQYLSGCECGVQVEARSASGWTPLMSAIDAGDVSMARILIDAGADVNLLWIKSYSCLSCAVAFCAQQPESPSRHEMVRLLITSGADIDAHHAESGRTPLHVATMFESVDAMALLVEFGADLTVTDMDNCTVADVAAEKGLLSVLRWLEMQGLTQAFEQETSTKQTPLTRAAAGGYLDVVEYLVRCQNDRWLRKREKAGTVTDYLCACRSQALYWALQTGNYEIVVFLCENGAKASRIGASVGYNHTTALHIAAKYGRLDIAEFLIENQGADVNYRNQRGRTPLHTAVIEGHLTMVKLLLVHGAEVDAVSKSRLAIMANKKADMKTALEFALWHGHYNVAELLLRHGAGVYAPISIAEEINRCRHVGVTGDEIGRLRQLVKEFMVGERL